MELAIAEPYFYAIHGGESSIPHYLVVYTYSLDEFYDMYWQDDLKFATRTARSIPQPHDLLRTYKHAGQHIRLQLVQVFRDDQDRDLCILHTYKLNLFKRLWRKRRQV
jgi:hypothetical protein